MTTEQPPRITLTTRLAQPRAAEGKLTLPFELRCRSRLRATLDDGRQAALYLERGMVLRDGDLLEGPGGVAVQVRAADETVSTVLTDDPLALARAAYHLGNRHVTLQVGPGWLRYLHDPVLERMVCAMGLAVRTERAPFEPEAGAYGGGQIAGHSHGHSHGNGQRHTHEHEDGDGHEHGPNGQHHHHGAHG
jgi:urease accessory protein